MTAAHLVGRFFGSLRPGGPSPDDERWARGQLMEAEQRLWTQLSGADRRHAVGVARRTSEALGPAADTSVLAAALLHDVGKLTSRLGTYGRVVATIAGKVAGRDMAAAWSEGRGFTRRVGLYLRHDQLGAEMLQLAGSAPLTAAWAAEHHLPPERWTVPSTVGAALKAADDD
jgi:hypothetical protein